MGRRDGGYYAFSVRFRFTLKINLAREIEDGATG
jgi:hypothetical protein